MEYSGAGGTQIHEKNQKQKISWHCPFKRILLMRWLKLRALVENTKYNLAFSNNLAKFTVVGLTRTCLRMCLFKLSVLGECANRN